jgi:5-(aminomethyl)-3-furanmethanol phosphate kinase
MWVVKLGGSLLGTPELQSWLDMLASQSDGRMVIVPGGGVFADAVREAQQTSGFDDGTAHHAALLAMDQFGLVLKSLQPKLVTASSELEIAERSWQHRAIVWLPSLMALADEAIPQNWDITSDSLAAWLAAVLEAERLVLVKSAAFAPDQASLARLSATGIVDAAFPEFAARLSGPIHIVGKSAHADFAVALAGGPLPALAI